MSDLSLFLADEDATRAFGEDLALTIRAGDCLALAGDLGAGKTALCRALIRALADDDAIEVPSPTFTLVQTYALRLSISHFDLYRLADESELGELGLDETLETGVALIEWPERAGSALPAGSVRIDITHEGGGRRVVVSTTNSRFMDRLRRVMAIRAFLDVHGHGGVARRFLTGDSSFRAYERIRTADGRSLVLMDSPEQSNGPPIRDGKPYSQLVHLAENVRPFIAVDRYLRDIGLSAPEIFAADVDQGILLIEDLGSAGVLDAQGQPIAERYEEAVRCLADFHRRQPPDRLPVPGSADHIVPRFERDTLKFECEVLLDWHVAWRRGEPPSETERRTYLDIWDHLIDELQGVETQLVLRDYHSPNLLWLAERRGFERIGIIDFQDAIIGPSSYDVVSITQDARVTVPRALKDRLVDIYMDKRAAEGDFDRESFLKSYAIMSAQRACRLNGLWVRLKQRDNMPGYMRHMPRTLWHLAMAFEHPVIAPLRDWCAAAGIVTADDPAGR
jgi:tRNA threonylcarbamoyl adenosine modification protein YjeE